ncbi:MAG: hypothetical protein PVG65_01155 [Candidatus Thorarchaeota archaeon]|jgi:hypothetical protein
MNQYLLELDENTRSIRSIISSANEAFQNFLKLSEDKCKSRSGLERVICRKELMVRAYKIKSDRLRYSIGKCRYTYKQKLCEKKINSMVDQLQAKIKKLDKTIRLKKQKIK